MKRVYGNTNTHLTLSDKAQKYYDLTDPIEITEHETEEGFLYSVLDGGNVRTDLTEDELNDYLEFEFDWLVFTEIKDIDPLIDVDLSDLKDMTADEIMSELDRVYAEAQAI